MAKRSRRSLKARISRTVMATVASSTGSRSDYKSSLSCRLAASLAYAVPGRVGLVHLVDDAPVALADPVSLHLEGRGDLVPLLKKIPLEHAELFDSLHSCKLCVDFLDSELDFFVRALVRRDGGQIALDSMLFGPLWCGLGVERHQSSEERSSIAHDYHLGDETVHLYAVLNLLRSDVLTSHSDDEVLLTVGDLQVAVLVE